MNVIYLIGNLTRDPELRVTQSGVPVCSFGIAVNRRGGGQNQPNQTEFFTISAWRGLGENCSRYLKKGNKVAVVGSLQSRTYTAQDGTPRFVMDVNATEVEFLTSPNAQGGGGQPQQGGYMAEPQQGGYMPEPQQAPSMGTPMGTPVFDDDDPLPF